MICTIPSEPLKCKIITLTLQNIAGQLKFNLWRPTPNNLRIMIAEIFPSGEPIKCNFYRFLLFSTQPSKWNFITTANQLDAMSKNLNCLNSSQLCTGFFCSLPNPWSVPHSPIVRPSRFVQVTKIYTLSDFKTNIHTLIKRYLDT